MQQRALTVSLGMVLAVLAGAAAAAPTEGAAQPAKWISREVNFTYQGFTTQYSCGGLRDNVVTILEALGARGKDLKIAITPCVARGNGEISLSPGVAGSISVLVPATPEEVKRGDPDIVAAHWHAVDLMQQRNLDTRRGANCELLEQSRKFLLPLFTTRNLDFMSDCMPHQTFAGGMTFRLEVLQADTKPAASP
ncbi:MAG TPA: hypothetical protein VMC02_03475 [Steroidobacteraceae bacterium]|nr:hypothetical protein [Steroidobacteraceae bacterium]